MVVRKYGRGLVMEALLGGDPIVRYDANDWLFPWLGGDKAPLLGVG